MSRSDWVSNSEIVGLIVVAVFVVFTFGRMAGAPGSNVQSIAKAQHAQSQEYGTEKTPRSANPQNQNPPKEYEPDCSNSADADLCAQRRMAIAAEAQTGMNDYGLKLLLATLIFTAAAAVFAGLTWRHMEQTAQRQLRAYLSAVPHFEGSNIDVVAPRYSVVLKNCGTTPAYNVRAWTDGVMANLPGAPPFERAPKEFMPQGILNPDQEQKINGFYTRPMIVDEVHELFHGELRYFF